MPARLLAAKTSAAFLVLLVTLLLLPLGQGCTSTCSSQSDCSGSDVCLFAAGSGCTAAGHCGQREPCVAQPTPIPLCTCGNGQSLNLFCTPEDGLSEQTIYGACPVVTPYAGGEAGGGSMATDAGADVDAGGLSDAGGQ
jgi:hypothetical protein